MKKLCVALGRYLESFSKSGGRLLLIGLLLLYLSLGLLALELYAGAPLSPRLPYVMGEYYAASLTVLTLGAALYDFSERYDGRFLGD